MAPGADLSLPIWETKNILWMHKVFSQHFKKERDWCTKFLKFVAVDLSCLGCISPNLVFVILPFYFCKLSSGFALPGAWSVSDSRKKLGSVPIGASRTNEHWVLQILSLLTASSPNSATRCGQLFIFKDWHWAWMGSRKIYICYSIVTCKVLLNWPHSKLGQCSNYTLCIKSLINFCLDA